MKKIFTPFSVGLVVLIALIATIWMFGVVREGIGDDPSGYRVWALFRDASGMTEKTRVVVAGITVGQIDHIELAGDQAKVWMLVNTPLTSEAHVAKRSASLLGEYFIQLAPSVLGTPLKDGDQLTFVDYDTDTADLLNGAKLIVDNVRDVTASLKRIVEERQGEDKIVEVLDKLNKTVAELHRIMGDNGHKVDRIMDNVQQVSEDARKIAAEARAFVKEFRSDAKVVMKDARGVASGARVIVDNVRYAVGEAPSSSGGVFGSSDSNVGSSDSDADENASDAVASSSAASGDTVGSQATQTPSANQGSGAVGRLQSALDHLDQTLAHTNSIAQKIDEGEGSIGRLVNDGHLVDTVTELVDESKDYISGLMRLQTIIAFRSEYYMGTSGLKNYASVILQPKPDKYYLLQLVDDPRGSTKFRETITRTTDSDEDPVVHTQETITEDTFRISLEFAKRIYMFTGRVGLIESTGGVGLDVHLFDDDLQLSADMYGFDENVHPHLKFWATYNFFTYLYLAAGVDEVLNSELTDWFIGAGIQFNDRDLKALLSSAPTP